VWFHEAQLSDKGITPLPGMRPLAVTWDGKSNVLYNTQQLKPPQRCHVVGKTMMTGLRDPFALEHAALRHGFTSTTWHLVSAVGAKPGVEAKLKIYDQRYAMQPVYNQDQLEWPIPVPDPPHRWGNGTEMRPHEQVLLEEIRQRQNLDARVWVKASYQQHTNNVRHGAVPVVINLGVPVGITTVLNTEQLVDAKLSL
jgi:hypothetical protein